jgi:hypothetical protein
MLDRCDCELIVKKNDYQYLRSGPKCLASCLLTAVVVRQDSGSLLRLVTGHGSRSPRGADARTLATADGDAASGGGR